MTRPPPRAAVRPHEVRSPFGVRSDPYYWLRDDERKDEEVLAYLAAENAYRDEQLAPLAASEERLFAEIVGRIRQDDSTVPARRNGYWYYTRFETGQEYPVHARRAGTMDAPEEILVDDNLAATGHDFYQTGGLEVSPDNRLLAWAEDTVGRRQFVVRFRNLATGEEYPDRIENVEADLAWANDGRTLVYVEKHPDTLLGFRVRKHVLGTAVADDPVIYEQEDESFYTGVYKSKSERFVFIVSQSTVASEYRYADAADPALAFKVAVPRERDHEYSLQDLGARFIIRSNWQGINFQVFEAPIDAVHDRAAWRVLYPHRADAFIARIEAFRNFLVIGERSGALRRIRVRSWDGAREFLLDASESAYTMGLGTYDESDTDTLRYVYSSLTTPATTFDFDMASGVRTQLKQEPVLGGFRSADYATELVWVVARDGARVPVSLLYRRDTPLDGTAPLYQYGYGAYGLSQDPSFRSSVLSLVDRGFVYAIAHIRGGQELGRAWYDAGRLGNKRNTFTDFIDVTRALTAQRYADPARVCAMGGSAGGLLIAAVANLAPADYRALVAHVPFVDIVTTMLDTSIPLTTNEYDEWGNPAAERAVHDYMLGYSPYDNVGAHAYPSMLVTTGLWDSQVQYWEPAKWVARLRTLKTDSNLLVFRTNLEAGHGGQSGRFQRYREIAEEYAFVLAAVGIDAGAAGV
jgi:oligopeptidase B